MLTAENIGLFLLALVLFIAAARFGLLGVFFHILGALLGGSSSSSKKGGFGGGDSGGGGSSSKW